MGGNSTSNGAALGSEKRDVRDAYDMRSWQGLTFILRAGKESLKDPHAYAEFRNLVLEYAQKGGDEEIKKKIDAIVRSFKGVPQVAEVKVVVPEPEKVKEVPPSPKKDIFMERRPTPSFLPKELADLPDIVEEEVLVPEEEVPAPVVVEEKIEVSTPAPLQSMDAYKARITEIKRSVHDTIGNPAALIDTHNDAGKKYMNALLTALKATSAGSTVGIESAMIALEDAYKVLIGESASMPKPKEEATSLPEVVEEPEEEVVPEEPPMDVPIDNTRGNIVPIKFEVPVPAVSLADAVAAEALVEVPEVVEEVTEEREEVVIPPISREEIQTMVPPRIPVPENTSVPQSELASPEISQALDNLLHEWSLFAGSGILGIGPGGSDHPLYRRISGLSMGEVLSGRFEKADQKFIKVIKQYVDAWRHEQGIAYTLNETFEHYLRRVVQRILKRQNS